MRVSAADVYAIRPSNADAFPFIVAASAMLDQYVTAAGWSTALATELERWLTAHLMELASPGVSRKRLGDTDVSYAVAKLGTGLQATRFGQTVLALDVTGTLAVGLSMRRATFEVF